MCSCNTSGENTTLSMRWTCGTSTVCGVASGGPPVRHSCWLSSSSLGSHPRNLGTLPMVLMDALVCFPSDSKKKPPRTVVETSPCVLAKHQHLRLIRRAFLHVASSFFAPQCPRWPGPPSRAEAGRASCDSANSRVAIIVMISPFGAKHGINQCTLRAFFNASSLSWILISTSL